MIHLVAKKLLPRNHRIWVAVVVFVRGGPVVKRGMASPKMDSTAPGKCEGGITLYLRILLYSFSIFVYHVHVYQLLCCTNCLVDTVTNI